MHSEVVRGSFRQMSFHWLVSFLNPWDHDYPGIVNTALVSSCNKALDTLPSTAPKGKFHHMPALRYATEASTGLDTTASSCASLQHAIRIHNFSTEIYDIILHSWRSGTISKYNSILQRWQEFCNGQNADPLRTNVNMILRFLLSMYKGGSRYSG